MKLEPFSGAARKAKARAKRAALSPEERAAVQLSERRAAFRKQVYFAWRRACGKATLESFGEGGDSVDSDAED